MRITAWGRRSVIAGCGVAAMLAITPVAMADGTTSAPPTSYAPITLSPEEAQQLCGQFLPKLADRTKKLTDRINGGAEVKGSVAWLKARAQSQRDKGHTAAADLLDQRAQRRAGRLDDLKSAQQKLEAFKTAHCKAVS
jgi:hypothetical protein